MKSHPLRIILLVAPAFLVSIAAAQQNDPFPLSQKNGVVYITNTKPDRAVVTIHVTSKSEQFFFEDYHRATIEYRMPLNDFGVLLLPGESRCIGPMVLPQSGTKEPTPQIELTYSRVGFYHPLPDTVVPTDHRPAENFVRFYDQPSCGTPSAPKQGIHMLSFHPTRMIRVSFKEETGGTPKTRIAILRPLGGAPVVCEENWKNVSELTFEFAD